MGENTFLMRNIAPDVKLGNNVKIYDFVNLYGCEIGDNTRISTFVEIQKGAKIGKNCKISSHTFICEGVTIEDNVFIGHNVTFINDAYPSATTDDGTLQTEEDWICLNIRAGFPATIVFGGTSFVTTLPAPTTAFSPTVIPHRSVALEPMEAPRFTSVGTQTQSSSVCSFPSSVVACG